MSTELEIRKDNFSLAETMELGKVMAMSGFFSDSKQAAQAVVKVLAGRELGLGPVASMTGIHIIKGKVSPGANAMATIIKNDPRYNYVVDEMSDVVCSISFFERADGGWKKLGTSTFTEAEAKRAGTGNMNKFPKNMLFARAMSNGAKWFVPGAFGGSPVYEPGELGASVDYETGEVVSGIYQEVEPETAEPTINFNLGLALQATTPKGTPLANLNDEQLQLVEEKGKNGLGSAAALVMLARSYTSLVDQALELGIDTGYPADSEGYDSLLEKFTSLQSNVETAKEDDQPTPSTPFGPNETDNVVAGDPY